MSINKFKLLIFIISSSAVILLSSCEKQRTPISYELPKKYVGWVTIKYEKPGAPPLEKIGDRYHIKIPSNGICGNIIKN